MANIFVDENGTQNAVAPFIINGVVYSIGRGRMQRDTALASDNVNDTIERGIYTYESVTTSAIHAYFSRYRSIIQDDKYIYFKGFDLKLSTSTGTPIDTNSYTINWNSWRNNNYDYKWHRYPFAFGSNTFIKNAINGVAQIGYTVDVSDHLDIRGYIGIDYLSLIKKDDSPVSEIPTVQVKLPDNSTIVKADSEASKIYVLTKLKNLYLITFTANGDNSVRPVINFVDSNVDELQVSDYDTTWMKNGILYVTGRFIDMPLTGNPNNGIVTLDSSVVPYGFISYCHMARRSYFVYSDRIDIYYNTNNIINKMSIPNTLGITQIKRQGIHGVATLALDANNNIYFMSSDPINNNAGIDLDPLKDSFTSTTEVSPRTFYIKTTIKFNVTNANYKGNVVNYV